MCDLDVARCVLVGFLILRHHLQDNLIVQRLIQNALYLKWFIGFSVCLWFLFSLYISCVDVRFTAISMCNILICLGSVIVVVVVCF